MLNSVVKQKVIGVDVGVVKTSIALVDIRGSILAQDTLNTQDYPLVTGFIEALSVHIMQLVEQNGGYETIRSVGISAPSANYVTGCIENAANMPWKGIVPLAVMLRDSLGLAVALGNDAHVTALGEYVYGSAHGMENFIVISLGHGGIGSCFYSNGRPYLGSGGFAGEIGHTCVEDGGRQCTCGRQGCLEEYASDRGILRTACELLESSDAPSLLRNLSEMTPLAIGQCADQGDALAVEVWRQTGDVLGRALANYASVINPEAIILTGEMIEVCKWLIPPMEQSFNENVFQNLHERTKLIVSTIDNHERDVLGASALAWTVKEYSLFL